MMKRCLILALTAMLLLSILTGCGGSSTETQPPVQETEAAGQPVQGTMEPVSDTAEPETTGTELVIAITKDENLLTPYTYLTGSPGLDVMRLIYDSLFAFDTDNNIIPWMVEDDYTVDSDSKVYELVLKDGLYWHDGTPLTAEDVKFTFDYPATQNRSRWKTIANQIESCEIDGASITITLVDGNPNFLRAGLCDMPIIPKHIYEGIDDAESYSGDTIGSSLYKLSEYKIGEYYKFTAVEGYFKGDAKIAQINMPIMTDSAAVSQAQIAGQIAAATRSIAPETFDVFQNTDGIEILSGSGYAPSMLQFNCERDILSDAEFRRALTFAIDIQSLIDTVTLGFAVPGLPGFYTADMPGARTDLTYEYNPDTANEMLDSLGYGEKGADGIRLANGAPIAFELLVYSSSTTRIRTAELIKEALENVGIAVTVTAMEADTVDEYVWPDFDVASGRDYDMAMWGWSAPVQLDPAGLVRLAASDTSLGNLNIGGLVDSDYDELCAQYLATTNPDERSAIAADMQQRLTELAPFVNLWYDNMNYAVNTGIYDGWVLQKGVGIINRFTFLP